MNTFERLVSVFNAVFEDEINAEAITLSANLFEDIGINSVGMLYMALALEEEFGVKFTNDDFPNIKTVKDVVDLIESKQ
jgi:acyl carrier protein